MAPHRPGLSSFKPPASPGRSRCTRRCFTLPALQAGSPAVASPTWPSRRSISSSATCRWAWSVCLGSRIRILEHRVPCLWDSWEILAGSLISLSYWFLLDRFRACTWTSVRIIERWGSISLGFLRDSCWIDDFFFSAIYFFLFVLALDMKFSHFPAPNFLCMLLQCCEFEFSHFRGLDLQLETPFSLYSVLFINRHLIWCWKLCYVFIRSILSISLNKKKRIWNERYETSLVIDFVDPDLSIEFSWLLCWMNLKLPSGIKIIIMLLIC